MSTFSKVNFGDGLTVVDEGAGEITVNAGGGGGGGGGGIQFDTYPQTGGFLAVQTDGPSLIDIPGPGQTSLYIADNNGGGGVFIESLVGGGVAIRTDGGPVDPGSSGINLGATNGGISLNTASVYTGILGCVFTLSMEGVADLYSKNAFAINSDLEITVDAPRLFIPHLPTTDPGVSHPSQIWADNGVLVLRGSTVAGAAGGIRFGVANTGSTLDIATTGSETHKLNSSTGQRFSVQNHTDDSLIDVEENGNFLVNIGSTQTFRIYSSTGGNVFDIEDQSGVWVNLYGTEEFGVFGDHFFEVTPDGIAFRIFGGKTVTVRDGSGNLIFQIDEDGDLHGKTGKALAFDL